MIVLGILILVVVVYLLICLIIKYNSIWKHSDCKSKVCLVGKTALVTGGSRGIGYQIVLGLASRGCRVIVADCNVDESIKDEIYKETHNSNVILKYVNLASFKSVREFADDIKKSEDKLDILINNAGVGRGKSLKTEDGINLTLQVNYFSAFLLTHLLLVLLRKSHSGGRIIFTSSILAFFHPLTVKNIQNGQIKKGHELLSYSISKFCQISASEIFAEKLKSYGITSNCFHPVAAKTDIFRNSLDCVQWYEYPFIKVISIIAYLAGKTPEEAAQTAIYLAIANEARYITGEFMVNMKPEWKPRGSKNRELLKAIWEESERVVKLKPEEKIV